MEKKNLEQKSDRVDGAPKTLDGRDLKKVTGGAAATAPTIEEIVLMSGGHRKFV